MAERRRKHWGWGYEDEAVDRPAWPGAMPLVAERLGFDAQEPEEPVALEAAALRDPRPLPAAPPAGVPWLTDDHARATHAWGKSYLDVVRAMRGRFDHAPDAVARPADEAQVAAVLEWASDHGVAVVPFGGGTSVVRRRHAGASTRRSSRSTWARWTGWSRSTRSRAPRASRPARWAPTWSASSPGTT